MKSVRMFEMDQRVLRDEAVEEGLKKGLRKGLREGRAEGRVEGRAEGRGLGLKEGRVEGAEAERRRLANLIKRGASIDTIKKALAKQTTRPTKKRTAATRN
ncbi:hypothetical protein R80B4_02643 [Fibrobacteres bacterium R8-0-B4]